MTAPVRKPPVLDDALALPMLEAAAGLDLLLAEMHALAALLPGHQPPTTEPETPGEPGFDDLPV